MEGIINALRITGALVSLTMTAGTTVLLWDRYPALAVHVAVVGIVVALDMLHRAFTGRPMP